MNLLSSSSSSSLLSSPSSWTCNSCWLFPSYSPNSTSTCSSTRSTTTSAGISNRRYYRFRSRCAPDSNDPQNKGNEESAGTDWDKDWSKFKKAATDNYKKNKKEMKKKEMKKRKSIVSNFNPDKYVSWDPRPSDFPLAEEFDPIRRAERSNLMLWTSPKFTLFGAIIIVTALLVYTLVVPQPK